MVDRKDDKDSDHTKTVRNVSVAGASTETVRRYGSANAEYVKAYTGVDNELGKTLDKGLKKISEYNVNHNDVERNIKQQAGYSGEVLKVAKDNAENIIADKADRLARTDDHPDIYGKNNQKYDHVKIDSKGDVIAGTESQMKIVTNYEDLLDKIVKGKEGTKRDLSRYQDVTLELASEQVQKAKDYCIEQARKARAEAESLNKLGKTDLAAQKQAEAAKYERLHDNIHDSGVSTNEAVFARNHPSFQWLRA